MKGQRFEEYPFTQVDIPTTSDVHPKDGYLCASFVADRYVTGSGRGITLLEHLFGA